MQLVPKRHIEKRVIAPINSIGAIDCAELRGGIKWLEC